MNVYILTHPCNQHPGPSQSGPPTQGSHCCVHGGTCEEPHSFLPFPLKLKPQRKGGSKANQVSQAWVSAHGRGVCVRSPPVLLGQVGLHVEEDVLPLLDVGAHLLNELRLLPTGMALVPGVRGVTETGGRIWKLWALPSLLPISMLLTTSILHLYSLGSMLAPC